MKDRTLFLILIGVTVLIFVTQVINDIDTHILQNRQLNFIESF